MKDDPGWGGKPWAEVPDDKRGEWNTIFRATKAWKDVPDPCPVCGIPALHQWFLAWHPEDVVVDGQRFVARGSKWEWCSNCHSYDHYTALVPDWWASDLAVEISHLKHSPEALEEALRKSESRDP
jgi:hypothetical protein